MRVDNRYRVTHAAGSFNLCDGRAEAVAAVGEITKSAKNVINSSVNLGSDECAKLKELGFNRPHFAAL
jgi:hypothetical protein